MNALEIIRRWASSYIADFGFAKLVKGYIIESGVVSISIGEGVARGCSPLSWIESAILRQFS